VVRVGFENKEKNRSREGSKIYVIIKYPTLCTPLYYIHELFVGGMGLPFLHSLRN
jgi:hypothetical protein